MKDEFGLAKGFKGKSEDDWELKTMQDMHFKNFYRALYEHIQTDEYVSMYEDDKFETLYDEFQHPNGSKEYRLRWRFYHKTSNPNVIIKHTLNWLVLDMKDKQIVIDGKKIKIQHGEVEIKGKTFVLVNKEAMEKKSFLAPFLNLFWDRWFKYLYEGYVMK